MESDRFDHHALGISIANRRGTGYFLGLNFFPKNMVLDSSGGLTIACIRSYRLFLESRQAGTGNAEWQTIIAAQEDRSILLPDGSSVYLRENSELSYPEVFASSVREVKIKGEAFFEVTPNSEQPFIVDASGLSVKVLGTSFSVQTSDQGNEISVILVEGKVSLNNAHEKELVQLHPNQKADYFVNDEHYTVTEVDSERLTSWRKGIIFYDNASLDEIVRLIEQTYKVSLMYTRPENDDQRFSGAFLKTQKLETVLQQTNKLTGTNLILIQ